MKFGSITTGIVSDGLVFNMDAANRSSYIPYATQSFNTTDLSISGSFISDPTYTTNPSAWDFDGVDDYIDCGVLSAYDTGDFSVSVWVYKTSAFPNPSYVISSCATGGTVAGFDVIIDRYDSVAIRRNTRTAKTYTGLVTSVGFTLNNWHHIAGTYEDSTKTLKLYIDGVLQDTTVGSASTNSASTTLNICTATGGHNFIVGRLANIQIYNQSLSASDVLHNYNALKGRFT